MASTTGVLERWLPIKMATVEEVFEEVNYPSLQKLEKVLDSRGIERTSSMGKNAAHDLVDFTAAPSDRRKRTGLGEHSQAVRSLDE